MKSIGMDVHQRQTVFHVVDERGRCLERGKVETAAEALQGVVLRHRGGDEVQVAIEASTPAFWVREALVAAGARVEVTNPYKVRLIAESRSKTDKNDAMILAELLRCGGLPRSVYVPEKEIRGLREQLGVRRQVIQIRSKVICSGKAALRRRGIKYEARAFHTGASWAGQAEGTEILKALGGIYERCEEERVKLEGRMREEWKKDPRMELLQSIPGVGPIVAMTLISAIGEISRFESSGKLSAYAGLVPSERSSGESTVRGGITHQGRNELRGAIVQAAWAVLRTKHSGGETLKRMFYKVMMKRGSQVAIVAVARKLLTIAYQVLKQGAYFDEKMVGRKNITSQRGSRKDSAMDLEKVA